MDTMAKAYWHHVFHHDDFYMPLPPQHQIYGEGWQLWQDGTKINNPKTDVLYNTICGPITRSWWARHGHISQPASQSIDWEVSGLTMAAIPQWLQQWVTKTASENCGVGTTLVAWQYQDDAKCPRCGHPLETTSHVSQCQAQGAADVWRDSMDKVEQYLGNSNTDPRIQLALLQALNHWQQMLPQQWQEHDKDIVQALQAQQTIGWQDWLEGLPAMRWRTLQQYHYNLTDDDRTGKAWLTGLTKLLIQAGQKQWQHRNDYKHTKGQPRYKEMVRKLDEEIAVEYSRGPNTLLPGDRIKLDVNLLSLLQKSVPYKQAWLSNVAQARERCLRIQQQDNDLQTKSYENSLIVKWQRTGVCLHAHSCRNSLQECGICGILGTP